MCGDSTRQSRGGALAVLNPRIQLARDTIPASLEANLHFHDQAGGNTTATHLTITSTSPDDFSRVTRCVVGIHLTGDLTKPAKSSPLLYKLDCKPDNEDVLAGSIELLLTRPLTIGVGGDGIIGRRVSVWLQGDEALIAEGIVGYN